VNHLDDNIDAIKKHTEALIDANKEDGVEVSAEKTNIGVLSRECGAKS
jgi:hypothetical protein